MRNDDSRRDAPEAGNCHLAHALGEMAPQRRREHLVRSLHQELCQRLLLDIDQLDPRDNLSAMGMDSMKAVELKQYLEAQLGLALHSSFAFDYPNVEAMASFLLQETGLLVSDGPADAEAPVQELPDPGEAQAEMEADLSEEDLAELLAQELSTLNSTPSK